MMNDFNRIELSIRPNPQASPQNPLMAAIDSGFYSDNQLFMDFNFDGLFESPTSPNGDVPKLSLDSDDKENEL